ncbi:unnamed protein product [Effrenium voratum]|nr:unnamed protein product [Effrenium voratum]
MLLCRLRPSALGLLAASAASAASASSADAAEQLLARLEVGVVRDHNNEPFAVELCLRPLPSIEGSHIARAVAAGFGSPWEFPHFGRCHLVTEEVKSLLDEELDKAILAAIFETAEAARSAGFQVQVSRHDLFHGHLFRGRQGRMGMLLHACEYPMRSEDAFPVNLGFCQAESPIRYADEVMRHRNLLVLFCGERTRSYVLDAAAPFVEALIPEYARKPLHTLYEDSLGQPLADAYFLPEQKLGWVPRLRGKERTLSKEFQWTVDAELWRCVSGRWVVWQASQTLSELPPLDQGLRGAPERRNGWPARLSRAARQVGWSYPARKENFKREQYFLRFESSQRGRTGSAGNPPAGEAEFLEAEELLDQESFMKDITDVDHHIQDLARSILFQHLERSSMEERAAAKAEEARRRKEAELRRARKKEQMARDPKRKVALKIENKRRFSGQEDEDDAKKQSRSIPLRSYEVYGEKGSSQVDIVDVLKIQSQCEMLNESGGVYRMLESRQRTEKLQRALAFTEPAENEPSVPMFQSDVSTDLTKEERSRQLRKDLLESCVACLARCSFSPQRNSPNAAMAASSRGPLRVLCFLGSTRSEGPPFPANVGARVAKFAAAVLARRGHGVEVADPLEIEVPLMRKPHFAYKQREAPDQLEALALKIREADAFVMISPEYNHTASPALLNLLNHFGSSLFSYKPSSICTYSQGQWGGARAGLALRPVLSELGCLPVSAMVHVPKAQEAFDASGQPADENGARWESYFLRSFAQMEWWAEAAKAQRAQRDPFAPSPVLNASPSQRNAP